MNTPIGWLMDPQFLTPAGKILAVTKFLRENFKFSATDLLLATLGADDEFKKLRDSFYSSNAIDQILNTIATEERGVRKLEGWRQEERRASAIDMVLSEVAQEMSVVKKCFQMRVKDVTPDFLLSFDLETAVSELFRRHSPLLRSILLASSRTARAERENTLKDQEISCSILESQICNLLSANGQLFAIPFALVLHSNGASRQTFDILSKLGLSISFDSVRTAHNILAEKMLSKARDAACHPHMLGYDNIQVTMSVHVEQRQLAPPKVQCGTTSIIYGLRNATLDAVKLKPILKRRALCNMISYAADVRPTRIEQEKIDTHLVLDIIEILLSNHPSFKSYGNHTELQHPTHRPPPSGFKTPEHVLRTTTINESTVDGNIEVVRDIYLDQLRFAPSDLENIAIPCINDQSTNARIRGAQLLRSGDLAAIHRMENFQLGPGAFHILLNFLWALLFVHRGVLEDHGSLQCYISVLRYTRVGSEHPDYQTLLTLVMRVLAGNIMHCWQAECGFSSLDDFAASNPTPETLKSIADVIHSKYASQMALERVGEGEQKDTILQNTLLLNRDLLLFYELNSSISSGDFGRFEIMLGLMTMNFSGAGSKNYATEFLYFIQNLKKVWTPEFSDVMRDNMFINPSGRDGHWMGVDLNIEHNINAQKRYFTSKGVHGTWEQLADLAPVIPIYRPLKKQFTAFMGLTWRGSNHTDTKHYSTVGQITASAKATRTHEYIAGRTAKKTSVDITERGHTKLSGKAMKQFKKRYLASVRQSILEEDSSEEREDEESEDEESDVESEESDDELPDNPLQLEDEDISSTLDWE